MDLSMPTIEDITGQQLRRLGLKKHREESEENDEDIYFEEILLDLEDNDSISAEESGFMLGYLQASD